MGMSASQARLIALTARMSDVEYEGQQINQQRLVLTNQMSAIYEALANMDVPTAPSKLDYKNKVYSGSSEGNNYNVRTGDNGQPYATRTVHNENIVKSGGRLDVGRGISKKFADVKLPEAGNFKDSKFDEAVEGETPDYMLSDKAYNIIDVSQYKVQSGYEDCNANDPGAILYGYTDGTSGSEVKETSQTGYTHAVYHKPTYETMTVQDLKDNKTAYDSNGQQVTINAPALDISEVPNAFAVTETSEGGTGTSYTIGEAPKVGDYVRLAIQGSSGSGIFTTGIVDADPERVSAEQIQALGDGPFFKIENGVYKEFTPEAGMTLGELDGLVIESSSGTKTASSGDGAITVGGNPVMSIAEAEEAYGADSSFKSALQGLKNYFQDPPAVDNAEHTWKDFSVIVSTDDQGKASFSFCITSDYKADAAGTGDGKTLVYNPTVGDYEERLSDAEFDPSSIEYTTGGSMSAATINGQKVSLGAESVFDEDGYELAMQKYNNEKAEYDDEQNRLNKQTSIYQRQDKQLELKLKRLDTERNALNTEIDAVKKVIQDATDKGFKTFSG